MYLRLACLVLCVFFAACGGPSFSNGVYRDGALSFRVGPLGQGWSLVRVGDQNDLAWEHGGTHAVVQVNASCSAALDIPLVALTNHLLIGFTERDVREQVLISLDDREALRTHVVAKLDGVPREFVLVVMKKNSCVFDFALLAAPGDPFGQVLPSFELSLRDFRFEDPRS